MNSSSLVGIIAQNKMYESHRRKIESIMTKSSHSLSFRKGDAFSNFYSSREKAQRFSQKSKQQAVEKENDLILKKIIDVNRRTHQTHQANSQTRQISHNNLSNLRKKLEKTNEENLKLASKLVNAQSKLSQNLLHQNNRRYNQIKERLKKYTVDESGTIVPKKVKSLVRMGRLDPLTRESMYTSRIDNQEM